jgi:hypothetical protein
MKIVISRLHKVSQIVSQNLCQQINSNKSIQIDLMTSKESLLDQFGSNKLIYE